jgi:Mitochondrial carrier protein
VVRIFSLRGLAPSHCTDNIWLGFLADFAASFIYVPSEVLKTRLQLQGRYRNPFFNSGYNYRGTLDAARTIARREGFPALFHGYKATIFRDLPFSALQFTFYEQGQMWARQWKQSREIGLPLELITGAAAGGLAGVITCPLDVVKTRIQTAIHPLGNANVGPTPGLRSSPAFNIRNTPNPTPIAKTAVSQPPTQLASKQHARSICTSSPSTHTPRPGSVSFDTSSVVEGLKLLYKTEGIAGWFRGVGPRFVWTSVQSGCMLFLYQTILRQLEGFMPETLDEW